MSTRRLIGRIGGNLRKFVLLHSCDMSVLQRGEALGALAKARAAGKIRFLGYSGDNAKAAFAAGLPEVDVLETSVNICDQANLDSVLPNARERNLEIAERGLLPAAAVNRIHEAFRAASKGDSGKWRGLT